MRRALVALTQHVLMLAAVVTALVPALTVVDLEIASTPQAEPGAAPVVPSSMSAYLAAMTTPSLVDTAPVTDDTFKAFSIAPVHARSGVTSLSVIASKGWTTTSAHAVTGYGVVGVTWAGTTPKGLKVQIRTRTTSVWGTWEPLTIDDDGPDSGGRQGTVEGFVGHVKFVQARVMTTSGVLPKDIQLDVIDPGTDANTSTELPAIDPDGSADAAAAAAATTTSGTPDAALSAAVYTPKPQIYSRAQWGANEKIREQGDPVYAEVHLGFVHHTVNSNNYTKAEVPAIIRAIYLYHVKGRGWRDIGYNFLIDKFGRIWQGRYGGVDRPVQGAQARGYNDVSFGASAIGNFQIAKPPKVLIQSEAALFAWQLSLYGINATATNVKVGTKTFKYAISGHRDANQTACPGQYLYAQLPTIRKLAASLQKGWAGRALESDLDRVKGVDLIARSTSDNRAYILPMVTTAGVTTMGTPEATNLDLSQADLVMKAGDWNRDGLGDVLVHQIPDPALATLGITSDYVLTLYRGVGKGQFQQAATLDLGLKSVTMLAAVGDVTGDGFPDLQGSNGATGKVYIWPGTGSGIGKPYLSHLPIVSPLTKYITGVRQIAVGRWDNDGAPDSIYLMSNGTLEVWRGDGPGGLLTPKKASATLATVSQYDWIVGTNNVNGTAGHADLIVRETATGNLFELPGATTRLSNPIPLGNASGYDLVG